MSENRNLSSYREPVILISFVIVGAIAGLIMGESAKIFNPIGQIWLNMLFVLLVPLIFFSISSAISNIADTRRVGKLLGLTIAIFVVTAAISGIYMFIVTGIFGVDTSVQLVDAGEEIAGAADSIGTQIVNTFTVSDFPSVISRSHILALIVFSEQHSARRSANQNHGDQDQRKILVFRCLLHTGISSGFLVLLCH